MATLRRELLENASATGQPVIWPGGTGIFIAEASDWNGASVALQLKTPQGTWIDVGVDTTLSANGMGAFILPPGEIRAEVFDATPTGLYAWSLGTGNGV